MAMSDEGFAHAMSIFTRERTISATSPLVPEHAIEAFLDRLEADKPMHINDGMKLVPDGPYKNAILAMVVAYPSSIVHEVWSRFVDNKASSLKKLLDAEKARRQTAASNALAQRTEHRRRARIRGDDVAYPKDTQSAEKRRDFVNSILGRGPR